jgi:hypothetical protein
VDEFNQSWPERKSSARATEFQDPEPTESPVETDGRAEQTKPRSGFTVGQRQAVAPGTMGVACGARVAHASLRRRTRRSLLCKGFWSVRGCSSHALSCDLFQGLADNYRGSAGRTRGSMTASLISYFKKKAKALKKAVALRDEKAFARVEAVRHAGTADFGLMKAQHVLAVESGFENWRQLIAASESELRSAIARDKIPDLSRRVQAVLDQHPYLTSDGFRAPHPAPSRIEPYPNAIAVRAEREELLTADGLSQVQAAMTYLDQLSPARVSSRNSPGSYSLKHQAERWHNPERETSREKIHVYVANGAFIVAALIKGFAIRREDELSPNCLIGVNPREVQALAEGIDPAALRVRPSPFVRWLFKQAGRKDPVGDLATDAKEDLRFPRGGIKEVRTYLSHYGQHVMDAMEDASAEWRHSK